MDIERVGRPVSFLLRQLEEDLKRDDLILLERVPAPRPGERYREVVSRFFTEFGIATVYIRVRTPSFERRYVLTARYDWSVGGLVEGWIVEGGSVKVFEPVAISLGDMGKTLEHFGDLFWQAEERVAAKKMGDIYREPPAD